jgi:hypothetical protein
LGLFTREDPGRRLVHRACGRLGAHDPRVATIGENAIVAANAVVTKDVEANTIVGGIPAKVIRSFEEE